MSIQQIGKTVEPNWPKAGDIALKIIMNVLKQSGTSKQIKTRAQKKNNEVKINKERVFNRIC